MKRKFNYYQFDIGDWVKVRKRLVVVSGGLERKMINLPSFLSKPITGRISGVKVFRTGRIELDWEEHTFIHKNTITCWEIRVGLLNRPFYALPENMELCPLSEIKNLELPVLDVGSSSWSEKDRKILSEQSKDWPRDPKGRWAKE